MAQEIKVIAEVRTVSGSTAARRLRREGIVPAVLATKSGEAALIQVNAREFERLVSQHAGAQFIVTLEMGDKSCAALLREIQRDNITGRIAHADFGEIDATHKVHIQVQVELVGSPDGVRNAAGVLEQQMHTVDVSCLPTDVIESITVDVTELKVGEEIKVSDINFGDKFTLVSHADATVAHVSAPQAEEVATEEAPSA